MSLSVAVAAAVAGCVTAVCSINGLAAAGDPESDRNQKESPSRISLLRTFMSEFVEITPGEGEFPKTFRMGSTNGPPFEQPPHDVRLEHSFAIARHEVPQGLYMAVTDLNPSRWHGPRNSVEMVTWHDANAFCVRITGMLRDAGLLDQKHVIRLPTESEWEYCCRAGTTTAYSFGDAAATDDDSDPRASLLDPYGWHTGNAAGNDPPVGALKPNPWGLYDMHGYLWEYVSDNWCRDYNDSPDERASGDGATKRVIRGGSWRDHYRHLRSSTRWSVPDHIQSDAIGFRCVKARIDG